MSIYSLHPHHGLCIAFFEGKGYSSEFTAHMAAFIRNLSDSSLVRLTLSEDVICAYCPNIRNHRCIHNSKVLRFDQAVLAACSLQEGQVLRWEDFRNMVDRLIIRKGILNTICGDCQWRAICQAKADRAAQKEKSRKTCADWQFL